MKERKKRKWLKYVIIIVVILAIIAGIVTFFLTRKKNEVATFSVNDLGYDNWWEERIESSGMIKEDKRQAIYKSSTQTIEKILVKEGQTVKKGDTLLKYNTTLSNLEAERKQIEIKKMELELDKAQKELSKIQNYIPGVPTYGSLPAEPTTEPENPSIPSSPTKLPKPVPENPPNETDPAPISGEGTIEKPYIYIWDKNKEFSNGFIKDLLNRCAKTEVVGLFMNRENNSELGNLISSSKIKFVKKDNDFSFTILEISGAENDPLYPNNGSNDSAFEDNTNVEPEVPDVGPIYTAAEIKKLTVEKENQISDIVLNIKVAKSELKKIQDELKNTTVTSKIDGVVKKVLSLEDESINTKPVIVVSSGGGYYVEGRAGELNLDAVTVGKKVNVRSYDTGNSCEGVVEKVSDYPITDRYYGGNGNRNISFYPYIVHIDEDQAEFKEGEYASLEVINESSNSGSFYLTGAFVISENGKNYVYVRGEGDKLEKREINIGKNMQGSLEIRGGISKWDRVAFPYGKDVKEGAPTREASVEELYAEM